MNRIDIITDIETLGTKTDSQIIQISAIAFDILTNKIIDNFNVCVDIGSNEPINVTGGTIKWWLKTNAGLLEDILNRPSVKTSVAIKMFVDWVNSLNGDGSEVFLWGNGILFDNKMIQAQCELAGQEYPIFYRNDRDMRTIVELASIKLGFNSTKEFLRKFDNEKLIKHDAFDDCVYQSKVISFAWKTLIK